jgi:hypothetical protein
VGRVVKILSFVRAIRNGVPVSDVKCDPGGGAIVTAEHTAPPGDDSQPLAGDYAAVSDAAGTGRQSAVGYYDPVNEPKAGPGEKRIYARDSAGTMIVELWLKSSGELSITNGVGTFTMEPGGTVNVNGARITLDGDFITKSGVSLDGHTHGHGADSDGNSQATTSPPNAG